MSDAAAESIAALWQEFVGSGAPHAHAAADEGYSTWSFGMEPQMADSLLDLVLFGSKRATTGSLWAYEAEGLALPRVGEFSVVTDGSGHARCILMTTEVRTLAFCDVDAEFAAAEGEGDLSLEYWRTGHWRYFTRELGALGIEPAHDMPVVCERFEVVWPVPAPMRAASAADQGGAS